MQENNLALTEEFNNTIGKAEEIHIASEYQGTYVELHQKLQSVHVANTMPAVSVMEIASTKPFAENGVIMPLDSFVDGVSVDTVDFYDGLLVNAQVNDEYYGILYLRSTPIFYMDTIILEAAELDPSVPETWDELREYCKTIKEKNKKYSMTLHYDI